MIFAAHCSTCGHAVDFTDTGQAPTDGKLNAYCSVCRDTRVFVELKKDAHLDRPTRRELVYPVLVEGTAIAHLATAVLDETGAGYRAICPAGPLITRPLQLIPAEGSWVWCGACRSWADAVGISLPTPATGDRPAAG